MRTMRRAVSGTATSARLRSDRPGAGGVAIRFVPVDEPAAAAVPSGAAGTPGSGPGDGAVGIGTDAGRSACAVEPARGVAAAAPLLAAKIAGGRGTLVTACERRAAAVGVAGCAGKSATAAGDSPVAGC